MKMTADIEQRFAAVDDTMATLEERLDAAEARGAELTKQLAVMQRLFSTWLDGQVQAARQSMDRPQQAAAGSVDDQLVMINARAGERQAKGGGAPTAAPVRFDGELDRINNKFRNAQDDAVARLKK
jgi:hypothetical protein